MKLTCQFRRFLARMFRPVADQICFFISIDDHHARYRRLGHKRWEGVLAAKATRRCFDAHHLEVARVQSPGVCTQSVMSTVAIRSNLMGGRRADQGFRRWFQTKTKNISRQNSETINVWMHEVFLHAHRVGTVHTSCLALSNWADDRAQIWPILKQNTNAQRISFLYCAQLWPHVAAIVIASCAVSTRESRYLFRGHIFQKHKNSLRLLTLLVSS